MGARRTVGAVMRYCILGEVRAFDPRGHALELGGRRQRMVLVLLLLRLM